ncbi:hypothetical protein GCG54_00009277 [Colletotrichum gloeosporioides]|uniref:Protein NO VEIN C-terminal domain-containing protein n=1 Tax=Colletotrichum gloeosporioides TaxID=474922 RepID=A0A8H4C3X5_COLGL|nr:uncharacterized protein GCG54_00009277 [Colletotrichum gloeosporioides]KAF3797306.1 hypothetical protein GCG54_00009277 [Colletotrichum gloeosporioides]
MDEEGAAMVLPGRQSQPDREQADAQIRELYERKMEMFKVKESRQLHERCLRILATDLYDTATHFILELLQNADDLDYANLQHDDDPTFGIVLSAPNNTFETHCNEDGFTIDHIESLCDVGMSKKARKKDVHSGYIGEKGIGFKSVFGVADVAYVSSGFYHFKLDTKNELDAKEKTLVGMLVPIPADYPSSTAVGTTRMLLQLKGPEAYTDIRENLKQIKPEILLFFRRLRRIKIKTEDRNIDYAYLLNDNDVGFHGETRTLTALDRQTHTTNLTKYIIVRHAVENMPDTQKRENISSSEITLAFPLTKSNKPDSQVRDVFSFIPVGSYGFRFIIQSDFILTANREQLKDCEWNRKLRHAIPEAFMRAIERFLMFENDLRYTWPDFLVYDTTHGDFWEDLGPYILRHAKSRPVLQSQAGNVQLPEDLFFVPAEYRLDGVALIDSKEQRKLTLAFEYTLDLVLSTGLRLLGVREMKHRDFISQFCEWVKTEPDEFNSKSEEWHREVAKILVRDGCHLEQLRELPIVPTFNGTFVPAKSNNLFRASIDDAWTAPSSLNLQIVCCEVRRDSHREALFEFLRVAEINTANMCSIILNMHNYDDKDRPPQDLVAELIFLFRNRSCVNATDRERLRHLWVVAADGRRTLRAGLIHFIDRKIKNNLILKHYTSSYCLNFMDSEYSEYIEVIERCRTHKEAENQLIPPPGEIVTQMHFRLWLEKSCGLARFPRLVTTRRRYAELTKEWEFLSQNCVNDLLVLVRDRWAIEYYQYERLIAMEAKKLRVQCRDGRVRELQETALATDYLEQTCPHLNFVELPDPEHEDWKTILPRFSVVVEVSVDSSIQELQTLCDTPVTNTIADAARRIYRHLSQNSGKLKRLASTSILGPKRLIFYPGHGWVSSDQCVWESPESLKSALSLAVIYDDCGALFKDILGIKDAGIREVVQEMECSTKDPSLQDTSTSKELILLLNGHISPEAPCEPQPPYYADDLRGRVQRLKIFPIASASKSTVSSENTKFMSLEDEWYINDLASLAAAFEGQINVLSFSIREYEELLPVVKWLRIESRLLSEAVREDVTVVGSQIPMKTWSKSLQMRAKFIAVLAEEKIEQTPPVFNVCQVRRLEVVRTIGQAVGEAKCAKVFIKERSGSVDIFVLRNPFDKPEEQVSRELLCFFLKRYSITDATHTSLVPSILQQDLSELPELLEQNKIRCPWTVDEEPKETDGQCKDDSACLARSPIGGHNASTTTRGDDFVDLTAALLPHRHDTPSPKGDARPALSRFKQVGLLGEAWMNEYFKKRVSDWDPNVHWTSRLRVEKGYPDFLGDESKTADFTYTDEEGRMLPVMGLSSHAQDGRHKHITYHIEVKGTVLEFSEPFHMSQHQMDMALKYSKLNPTDIYVIARVYHLDHRHADTRVRFYINPWRYISAGRLKLRSEGYEVIPAEK